MSARREGGGESVPGATLHLGCDTASFRVRHGNSGATLHLTLCIVPGATLHLEWRLISACDTASRMAADLRVTIKRAQFNVVVQRAGSQFNVLRHSERSPDDAGFNTSCCSLSSLCPSRDPRRSVTSLSVM
jgi:hypothetical protein